MPRNEAYQVTERALTDEIAATTYNNYYEFSLYSSRVWQFVSGFTIEPWTVQVDGLCHNPGTYSMDDLLTTFDHEERIYRFRCVETWAMTVPWAGFPLAELVALAEPMGSAQYVAMLVTARPK